jgi:hypothetical protein
MKAVRTLLLLDGIEPLQDRPDINGGRLRDNALARLLRDLALGHPGLVVITSRQPLPELEDRSDPEVINHELDRLPTEAGVQLLVHLGCNGTRKELDEAVIEVGNHALSVTLLGSYIDTIEHGIIARRDKLGLPQIIGEAEDIGTPDKTLRYARRAGTILRGFVAAFEAETKINSKTGSLERMLLNIVGLFDRPADGGSVRVLLESPSIEGLTKDWHADGRRKLRVNAAKARLRDLRLLSSENPAEPDTLDAHPIIRDYFAKTFKIEAPEAFRAAHERLYRHYTVSAPELPNDLATMQPLFHAIGHGCAADLRQEALDDVYFRRIRRGDSSFIDHKLGAYAADLGALAQFFDSPWDHPYPGFSLSDRGWLLNCVAASLRALNRLEEAESVEIASLEIAVAEDNWRNAAIAASGVSEMRMLLGRIHDAISMALHGVELATRSGDERQMAINYATLADVTAHSGDATAALKLFEDAEQWQSKAQPGYPQLYSAGGFQYCDLLLDLGRVEEVNKRSLELVAWRLPADPILDIALDTLTGARAAAAISVLQKEDVVLPFFDQAISQLLKAASSDYIPCGYLERAAHLRRIGHFELAAADLNEVLDLARRGGMKLFLADYRLESARLALAQIHGAPPETRISLALQPDTIGPADQEPRITTLSSDEQTHLRRALNDTNVADSLIAETGYHRRDRELSDLKRRIAYLQTLQ